MAPAGREDDELVVPEPWCLDATAVADSFGTDAGEGLSSLDAAERLARYGPNQLDSATPVPRWQKLLEQVRDPLVYLLMVAVLVSALAWIVEGAKGVPFNVLVIAAIILANAVLGYVQQARAEQAVAALQRMAATSAAAVRDGLVQRIPTAEIVPGDVLLLAEGDAVSADARLIEAASLRVTEASLTGESEPVLKDRATLRGPVGLGDRLNMVFSGTAVSAGRGRAVVTATGMNTEFGSIARMLERTGEARTPLQREVNLIGRTLGVAVTVIALVVCAAILLTSRIETATDLVDVLLLGVSLAVAAVPEGLPAVLSVVLALGVLRMSRQGAIVKKLASVETLGSATVICCDKTGTLTRNEMTVTTIVTGSAVVELTATGNGRDCALTIDGRRLGDGADDAAVIEEVRLVLGGGSLANDAVVREVDGEWAVQGDPTDAAFLVADARVGAAAARRGRFERVGELPFTSERKLMSTIQADSDRGGRVLVVTKGAPDVVLARCTEERVAGEVLNLTESRREEILAAIERLADQALRPLAVAHRWLRDDEWAAGASSASVAEAPEAFESGLTYLGTAGIIDPPRPEAAAAIRSAGSAGLRVMMITGDHPRTALRIATELGLAPPEGRVVTGAELEALDDAGLRDVVREAAVYARVAPQHKLRIVAALQAGGEVVAMTGDGVNDAPALRAADIGVAMGLTGTDVTREAADMILADDNFATIVAAVREGRAILANIRTFLRYLLSSNAGEVLTMFLGVMGAGLLGLDATGEAVAVPLLATQILWINLLTDTAPALALGVDPPHGDVMSRPPRRMTDRVVDREMQVGVLFIGLVMALATLLALDLRLPGGLIGGSGSLDEARTMAFTTLVLAQLYNCFNARSDRTSAFRGMLSNRLLWLAIGASFALQVAVVHLAFLNDAFRTAPLSATDWAVCGTLASSVLCAGELRKLVTRRMRRRLARPMPEGATGLSAGG